MARCDMILGERFHGVILSLNNKIPVFGLSYKPKVERLYQEIGHDDWYVKLDSLTPATLIEGFQRIWDKRDSLKDDLEQAFAQLQGKALRNFPLLEELLRPGA